MFVWSKQLVAVLLRLFVLMLGVFLITGAPDTASGLKIHTTRWMALNYIGVAVWFLGWIGDRVRRRAKTVWLCLVAFALAPLSSFLLFVLFLERLLKPVS